MTAVQTALWLAAGIASLLLPLHGPDGGETENDEVVWARRVATEFFESALAPAEPGTFGSTHLVFLTHDLATEVKKQGASHSIVKLVHKYRNGRFRIRSAEVSPSKSEVVLTCALIATPKPKKPARPGAKEDAEAGGTTSARIHLGDNAQPPADATVWLAKDTTGRWSIRFIRARVRKDADQKGSVVRP